MPIELTCSGCGKRLRLADEHAGKQAKCPACQALFQAPAAEVAPAGEPFLNLKLAEAPAPEALPPKNPFASDPAGPSLNPFAAPQTTGFAAPGTMPTSNQQTCGTLSVVLGVLGIGMNLLGCCCVLFGLPGVLVSGAGLALAFYAQGGMRIAGFVLNAISLSFVLVWIGVFEFGLAAGAG